ncbi:Na+/H+ antiporter NhaA [Porphyromonas levii]|uniref:Na+/H+ antiporter NhaA n=1 Tax=Porphyromonas levii TaxID=28114 RepID=UPI00037EAB9A|nr:Na+/H+ antiporter NhaA [Porphyromonas levii]MBR8704002.1 Na(+)/H(+) antiporter NhaA [Porphyromonas levii]MBR8713966.1 Na(+)/H(+) antiporter NhaA [Porphyromonas levii]MBR8715984.1 Na(+)/H(+) antiporter NhaA [Porphyromonas levii]MBR8728510.1 Na(+)/H(+) antiporter NhaA [Porphyromonas levii]MBR8730488.1 Na(+)/H(+) antiporter NhaA [Porphyromonas levii]
MVTLDPRIEGGRNPLKDFVRWVSGINPSVFMFIAAIMAIVFANTDLRGIYSTILDAPVNLEIGGHKFFQHHGRAMTLAEFVNDALMVLFFFSVGLEIKREMVDGSLSSFRKAMLPVIAAVGGMIMPVLIFLMVENQDPIALRGMAIPMATDIAFALAVLGLLGKRVPVTLKLFLMALAVVDDIGGILVIAIFYSTGIQWTPLIIGLLVIALSLYFSKKGVAKAGVYYILLFIVWTLFMQSGIHSTIAGVLMALTIPHKPTLRPDGLEPDMRKIDYRIATAKEPGYVQPVFLDEDYLADLRRAQSRIQRTISPVQSMEHEVSPWVNYFVLPLFAFSNAGIDFTGMGDSQLIVVAIAIAAALFVGKVLGIFGFTYLFTKLKVVKMTPGMTYSNVLGVSMFGGIGFTVSLFIATLAFLGVKDVGAEYLNMAKLGIIIGTLVSGTIGVLTLNVVLKREVKMGRGASSPEYKAYLNQHTTNMHPM